MLLNWNGRGCHAKGSEVEKSSQPLVDDCWRLALSFGEDDVEEVGGIRYRCNGLEAFRSHRE